MTNYEIWTYDWKNELTPDERRIYKFNNGASFVEYVSVCVRAHKSATVHYDKETDTVYTEE